MKLERFLNELSRGSRSRSLREQSEGGFEDQYGRDGMPSDRFILVGSDVDRLIYNPKREQEVRKFIKDEEDDDQGSYFDGGGSYRGEGKGPWVVDRDFGQFELFPTWKKAFAAYAKANDDANWGDPSLTDKKIVDFLMNVPERTILQTKKAYKNASALYKALGGK